MAQKYFVLRGGRRVDDKGPPRITSSKKPVDGHEFWHEGNLYMAKYLGFFASIGEAVAEAVRLGY